MDGSKFAAFAANEEGATSIEYALIAGIISIAIVSGLTQIGGSLQNKLNNVATGIQQAGQ